MKPAVTRQGAPSGPWSYEAALAHLEASVDLEALVGGRFDPPTLDRMERLAALSADPQRSFPTVHVTGTNGKGSTARMVTALLATSGLTIGTYTSPDLGRVNERISRNGSPIDDDAFSEAIAAVAGMEAASGIRPTRFEILTLAAFRWFADVAVDVAVVEVGMGGRWDATNILEAAVAVVTNVGLDHVAVLGPTRADIAREKAGIVTPACTLVLGETDPELVPIFEAAGPMATWRRHEAFDCQANEVAVGGRALDLRTPQASYDAVFLPLHGAHQGDNAAAAVAAVEAFFGRPTSDDVLREALGGVTAPGRFEVVGRHPLVVLDGAHNPDGCRAAAHTLDDFSFGGRRILVVGMNRGRSATEMLAALEASRAGLVVACAADWPRAMPPEDVAAAATALGVDVEVVPGIAEAVRRAVAVAGPDDAVLVTGSLHVVGAARSILMAQPGG